MPSVRHKGGLVVYYPPHNGITRSALLFNSISLNTQDKGTPAFVVKALCDGSWYDSYVGAKIENKFRFQLLLLV